VPYAAATPRQARHRHDAGDNKEDQFQARKPEIIARQPGPELPARHLFT
jgi:hypothetical protein